MYVCMYVCIYVSLLGMGSWHVCTGIIYTWAHWHLQMLSKKCEWNQRCPHAIVLERESACKQWLPQIHRENLADAGEGKMSCFPLTHQAHIHVLLAHKYSIFGASCRYTTSLIQLWHTLANALPTVTNPYFHKSSMREANSLHRCIPSRHALLLHCCIFMVYLFVYSVYLHV